MAAFAAMFFLTTSGSFGQADPTTKKEQKDSSLKIKTPDTGSELSNKEPSKDLSQDDEREARPLPVGGGAPRKLRQHGLGLGIGETFLFGNYGKHGNDKITMDLFYSYAASYSFDLLVNAHMSEHEDSNERMKVMGLTSSIKGRFVEYDNLSPYFLGGLGFYAPRAKRIIDGATKWSDQKVTFGLNFGSGVDLRLNDHYVIGILGQLHWPFKVEQDAQSDLKGYYFKLLITGMYLF
jgi:hypothetical protein